LIILEQTKFVCSIFLLKTNADTMIKINSCRSKWYVIPWSLELFSYQEIVRLRERLRFSC